MTHTNYAPADLHQYSGPHIPPRTLGADASPEDWEEQRRQTDEYHRWEEEQERLAAAAEQQKFLAKVSELIEGRLGSGQFSVQNPSAGTGPRIPRRRMTQEEAESIARRKFGSLRRLNNKAAWARAIGCNPKLICKLPAWSDGIAWRRGCKQRVRDAVRTISPEIVQAILSGDKSVLGALSAEDRDRLDAMTDEQRQEFRRLVEAQAADE